MPPAPFPSYANLNRYLVTTGLALLALFATLVEWSEKQDLSWMLLRPQAFHGEPWRFVTCCLLHGNPLHLFFNLYWLWIFGTLIEEWFGSLRTAGLYFLLALGAGIASGVFGENSIGLSGVIYGLFGFLWILSRHDERFWGAIDPGTTNVMVGWFFICIFLTRVGAMRIANIAHGAGAILGLVLGMACADRARRPLYTVLLIVAMVGALGYKVYEDRNRGAVEQAALETLEQGRRELAAGQPAKAIPLLQKALEDNEARSDAWYYLGLAQAALNHLKEADAAFAQAVQLEPDNRRFRQFLAKTKELLGDQSHQKGNDAEAVRRYRRSLDLNPQDAQVWYKLGIANQELGEREAAREAYTKAAELNPDDDRFKHARDQLNGARQEK